MKLLSINHRNRQELLLKLFLLLGLTSAILGLASGKTISSRRRSEENGDDGPRGSSNPSNDDKSSSPSSEGGGGGSSSSSGPEVGAYFREYIYRVPPRKSSKSNKISPFKSSSSMSSSSSSSSFIPESSYSSSESSSQRKKSGSDDRSPVSFASYEAPEKITKSNNFRDLIISHTPANSAPPPSEPKFRDSSNVFYPTLPKTSAPVHNEDPYSGPTNYHQRVHHHEPEEKTCGCGKSCQCHKKKKKSKQTFKNWYPSSISSSSSSSTTSESEAHQEPTKRVRKEPVFVSVYEIREDLTKNKGSSEDNDKSKERLSSYSEPGSPSSSERQGGEEEDLPLPVSKRVVEGRDGGGRRGAGGGGRKRGTASGSNRKKYSSSSSRINHPDPADKWKFISSSSPPHDVPLPQNKEYDKSYFASGDPEAEISSHRTTTANINSIQDILANVKDQRALASAKIDGKRFALVRLDDDEDDEDWRSLPIIHA